MAHDIINVKVLAVQRDRYARVSDDVCIHGANSFNQCRLCDCRPAGRIQAGDRLLHEFATGRHPIKGILDRAGDTMGIFGTGDQDCIRATKRVAKRRDIAIIGVFIVRIKDRKVAQAIK